jgi:membrane associated rhomboid family serine protease
LFLPIGDTPNPRHYFPLMNWALIAINVLVYLLISLPMASRGVDFGDPLLLDYLRSLAPPQAGMGLLREIVAHTSAYDLFVFSWGYKPGAPQVVDLFASMFLHGGFMHLAGNMLFLWIFGDNVEHRLGRLTYLAVYLLTGVVATLTFSLFAMDSTVPLVGASGAISGVLGLYFILFPRNKVKVFMFIFPIFMDVMLLPVRLVLGFYVLVDNLLPFVFGAGSNVAYGAHLGGFVAGLGISLLGERISWSWPSPKKVFRSSKTSFSPPLQDLKDAILAGDRPRALNLLSQLQMERGATKDLPPDECSRLAMWLGQAGQSTAANRVLRTCLAAHADSDDLAKTYLAMGLLRLSQGQETAAYQHLLSVLDVDPDPQTASQARSALEGINVYRGKRHH